MNNLKKHYLEKVVPALKEKFGYRNIFEVPQLKKVVINVGLSQGLKDNEYLETVKNTIKSITGQRPVETLARLSISNFKIREGMVIGVKVTLRGDRMWDFVEKLVKITLPRVRDFHGITAKGFDKKGNYMLGFKECIAFPEVKHDEMERVHGLGIAFTSTAKSQAEGRALLENLGFPFSRDNK